MLYCSTTQFTDRPIFRQCNVPTDSGFWSRDRYLPCDGVCVCVCVSVFCVCVCVCVFVCVCVVCLQIKKCNVVCNINGKLINNHALKYNIKEGVVMIFIFKTLKGCSFPGFRDCFIC